MLPAGYKRLKYIELDGRQCFSISEFTFERWTTNKLTMQIQKTGTAEGIAAGSKGAGGFDKQFAIHIDGNGGVSVAAYEGETTPSEIKITDGFHTVVAGLDDGWPYCQIDGGEKVSAGRLVSSLSSFFIGAGAYDTTPYARNFISAKIGNIEFEQEGVVLARYIPVLTDDNEAAFYEELSGTLHLSDTEADFIAGPLIYKVVNNDSLIAIADAIRKSTASDKLLTFPDDFISEIEDLAKMPSDYIPLEYLQVTDYTSRINTGLRAYGGDDYRLAVEMTYSLDEIENDRYVFGNFPGYDDGNYLIGNRYTSHHTVSGAWSNRWDIAPIDTGVKHTVSVNLDKGDGIGIYFDGEKVQDVDLSRNDTYQNVFYTASNHDDGRYTTGTSAKAKHYGCDIWINGKKERSFIPVRNDDTEEVGFWDLVHRNFYPSIGAPYVAGPDK